jgi:S1-C subfamily serine protease
MARRRGIEGIVVLGVVPGSAADRAGLTPAEITGSGSILPRDVIVGIDDTPIGSSQDILAELDERAVGDEVTLSVSRDGRRREVPLTLEPGA